MGFFLFGMACFAGYMVHLTGGTHMSYVHFLYIPIFGAGLFFGPRWGLSGGLLAGLILGPWMPEDVILGKDQTTGSWLVRLCFFGAFGAVAGYASQLLRDYFEAEIKKAQYYRNSKLLSFTGLQSEFQRRIADLKGHLTLLFVTIKNYDAISDSVSPLQVEELHALVEKRLLQKTNADDMMFGQLNESTYIIGVGASLSDKDLKAFAEEVFTTPYELGDLPIALEVVFSLIRFPEHANTFEDLIQRGQATLRSPEAIRTGFSEYSRDSRSLSRRNLAIFHHLRRAINEDKLDLAYQPIINLQTGLTEGVEALARWNHPTLGDIPASEFIPQTEKTLLVEPFTEWLINKALPQFKFWLKEHPKLTLSLNISVKNLMAPNVAKSWQQAAMAYNIRPSQIQLEVTESAIAEDLSTVVQNLHDLREAGFRIVIDDFGTGQSSLQYLFEMPVDQIKIDRIFTQAMHTTPNALAIIKSTLALCTDLNIGCVAEGIETEAQYEMLRDLDCASGQGYFISMPLTAEETQRWLRLPYTLHPTMGHSKHP